MPADRTRTGSDRDAMLRRLRPRSQHWPIDLVPGHCPMLPLSLALAVSGISLLVDPGDPRLLAPTP